jgi:hypothetical protein
MKLLLIDDTVKYEPLINARKEDVDYMIFNAFEETYNSLLDKIVERNVTYTDIALVQHASQRLEFIILQKEDIATVNDEPPYPSFSPFKQFLIGLKKLVGVERLDLLGCLLYRNIKIHDIVKYLEDETGIDLRASTNFTGNPGNTNTIINENGVEVNIGADWIMESDNVDIRENYFTDSIRGFKDILYTFIHNNPINNKYSGAGSYGYGYAFIDSSKNVYYAGKGNNILNSPTFITAPNITYTQIDISAVIPNYQSYAVIDKSNNIWSWGASFTGGNDSTVPTQKSIPGGVRNIVATDYSYSALDNSANVWIWGNPSYGGVSINATQLRIDSASGQYLSNISSIVDNTSAFCGIGGAGNVWAWGDPGSGGSDGAYAIQLKIDNATTGVILSNIVKIYCVKGSGGSSSFLHLDASGDVYVNGASFYGGNGVQYTRPYVTKVNGVTGITTVVAIEDRYSVMDASGKVWLLSSTVATPVTVSSVQLTGITDIYTTNNAFYAVSGTNIYRWRTSATATSMTGVPLSIITKVITNKEAIAILNNTGNVWISGSNQKGGNGSTTAFTGLSLIGITNIYYVDTAFAAINAAGNVWIWGEDYAGGNNSNTPIQQRIDNSSTGTVLSGITYIVNAEKYHYGGRINAFVALHNSGNVYTWGSGYYSNGANYASVLKDIYGNTISGITNLYCNYASFIAQTNGGFYTWGVPNFGALATSLYKLPNITNAKKIYSTRLSYAIIDDSFNTWVIGLGFLGGSSSATVTPMQILSGIKIMYIYPNYNNSFLAVSETGRGYVWFDAASITTLTTITQPIIKVVTTVSSFAILDFSNNVWILGTSAEGGNGSNTSPTKLSITNITTIYSTEKAFAAVDASKNVWIWGASTQGGNGTNVPSQLKIDNATTGELVTNIVNIYSPMNAGAFAALDASGNVYIWGSDGNGGNGQSYATLLKDSGGATITNIKYIAGSGYSFAAINTSNLVWIWGGYQSGGNGDNFASKLRNVADTADFSNAVEIGSTLNYTLYRNSSNQVYYRQFTFSLSVIQLPVSDINNIYTASFGHLLTNTSNNVYTSATAMGSEQRYGSLLRYTTRLTGTPFVSNKRIVASSLYYFALTDATGIIYTYGDDNQTSSIAFPSATKPLINNVSNPNLYASTIPTLESNIYVSLSTIPINSSSTIINNVDSGTEPYTYTWRDYSGQLITNNSVYTVNNNILTITNNGIFRNTSVYLFTATVTDSSSTPITISTPFTITLTGNGNPTLSRLNASAITIPLASSQQLGVSVAGGIPPYTYKWFTDANNPLQTTTNTYTTTSYYTITNNYLLKNTTIVQYSALVCDIDPAINSQVNYSITLIGYGNPIINLLNTVNITIPINGSQQVGISISAGLPPYTYKWYTNSNNPLQITANTATTNSYYTITNGFNKNTVTIPYYIDVSDSDPTTLVRSQYNITFIGYGIPVITQLYASAIGIFPNASQQIGISISGGLSPYTYTWYNDTTNTLLQTISSTATKSTNITLLNNFNYSTDTIVRYRVDISDSDPTTAVQSSYYTITYVAKQLTATITSTLGPRLELPFDQSTTLTASADGGLPPYRYTWYSVGNPDVPLYNNALMNISGNTLTIFNNRQYILPTRIGYKCIVHNG